MGIDVVDLGLSTTPTVELAVPQLHADGGLILTASHNPREWNALKLLDRKGEFLSGADGDRVLELARAGVQYASVEDTGRTVVDDTWLAWHVQHVLNLDLVNAEAVEQPD